MEEEGVTQEDVGLTLEEENCDIEIEKEEFDTGGETIEHEPECIGYSSKQ